MQCSMNCADFQGPSRVTNEIPPIYYKRPGSYPAATSEPKKRTLERRPPPRNFTRSRATDHCQAELQGDHLCCLQLSQQTKHSEESESLQTKQLTHQSTETPDYTEHNTETCDSG